MKEKNEYFAPYRYIYTCTRCCSEIWMRCEHFIRYQHFIMKYLCRFDASPVNRYLLPPNLQLTQTYIHYATTATTNLPPPLPHNAMNKPMFISSDISRPGPTGPLISKYSYIIIVLNRTCVILLINRQNKVLLITITVIS